MLRNSTTPWGSFYSSGFSCVIKQLVKQIFAKTTTTRTSFSCTWITEIEFIPNQLDKIANFLCNSQFIIRWESTWYRSRCTKVILFERRFRSLTQATLLLIDRKASLLMHLFVFYSQLSDLLYEVTCLQNIMKEILSVILCRCMLDQFLENSIENLVW